jgi:CopG family nickel-responsive transcriptional regulator
MESELLQDFDRYIEKKNYSNRSEAIRDMIRDCFTEEEWAEDSMAAGAIVIKCKYGPGDLSGKLLEIQHKHRDVVVSSLHVHLDDARCMRIIVVMGHATEIKEMAHEMQSLKGVYHCEIAKVVAG